MTARAAEKLIKEKYPNTKGVFCGMQEFYKYYYEDDTFSKEVAHLLYSDYVLPNGNYASDTMVKLIML